MTIASRGSWTIRPFEERDLPHLVRLANNGNVARNLADIFPQPYTNADACAWLERVNGPLRGQAFAIAVDNSFAGGIGCHPQSDVKRHTGLLGYWLGEPFWGRGIMTWAIGAMVEYILRMYPELMRIHAEVFGYNPASGRVLEKNGFRREGILRNGIIKNGTIADLWCYGLLRTGTAYPQPVP